MLNITTATATIMTEDVPKGTDARAGLLCRSTVAAALRQGAYAVYGTCGTVGVQYVYASLGSRGSGGLWRSGLAALKADYEKNFKYTGKV